MACPCSTIRRSPVKPSSEASARPTQLVLRMNQVIAQSLEGLAQTCGFNDKLARLLVKTPIARFGALGYVCQASSIKSSENACLAESVRRK